MPGARVPSNQALAEATGTSVFTVQSALARLTKEGLIERKRRVGTFVKGGDVKLDCVGMYFGSNLWHESDSAFYQLLHRALRERLESMGLKVKVWVDDRKRADHHKIFAPVKRAVDSRDIQALLGPMTDPDTIKWLSKLPVASAFISTAPIQNKVGMSFDSLISSAIKDLHASGCKKIACLSSVEPGMKMEGSDGKLFDFYQGFREEAARFGMEVRDSWICTPPVGVYPDDKRKFGYDTFRELWGQPERPDGLFVFPDQTAIGVVTAILALQVSVPTELKLVLHGNDQSPYLCPVPATFLITNIGEMAEALVGMIKSQVQGLPVHPALFPPYVRHSDNGFPGDIPDSVKAE